MRKRLYAVLLAVLWCASKAYAGVVSEYELKAAFLVNLSLFVEWPAAVGSPLAICVLGEDPFGTSLKKFDNRLVGRRVVKVRQVTDSLAVNDCNMVFVTKGAVASLPQLMQLATAGKMVTIADGPGLAEKGAMINMLLRNDKIRFEVNLSAAKRSGVELSSQLLQLAIAVH